MDCTLDTITVHYETFGEGRPFVMLHGAAGDHRYWSLALEPLFVERQGWKRIYPDLPGHGRTAAPVGMETQDQVLDVLLAFIDRVIPGEKFALGGYSWGGYLAQGLLHHRLSQAQGCLFVAPSVYQDRAARCLPVRTILVRDETPLASLDDGAESALLRYLYEDMLVVQTPEHMERMRRVLLPAAAIADDEQFGIRLKGGYSCSPDGQPHCLDKPTLFLAGRQDALVGYQDQWAMIEAYPRATFAVLDSAGHGLAGIEQVELCHALIDEWLGRVERSWSA